MAIVDMKGTVSKDQPSMTGMVNESPKAVNAPNLSGMNTLFKSKPSLLGKVYSKVLETICYWAGKK